MPTNPQPFSPPVQPAANPGCACRKWMAVIGGVFLLALLVLGAAWYFVWYLPVGDGPAGPKIAAEPFQSTWTSRPVLLVGLGDSVTAGFGASPGCSYFQRLATNSPGDFPEMRGLCLSAVLPNLRVTNLALSGSTSLQHWRSQLPRLAVQPSNVLGLVVMTTGGNDIIHNYGKTPPAEGAMFGASFQQAGPWIRNFESRLESMVTRIQSCFPGGCHIFLANIYDPTDGTGAATYAGLPSWPDGLTVLEAYNRIIADCAARHPSVHLVNIHGPFLGHGVGCTRFWTRHYKAGDPHYWYHLNLEDPNDRGYDALRRLFLGVITEVFSRQTNAESRRSF